MYIHQAAGNNKDVKSIPFREILECYEPATSQEEFLKATCSKKFQFPFFLKTKSRHFLLFASTHEERRMWLAGFQYVILSTKEVQKIIE